MNWLRQTLAFTERGYLSLGVSMLRNSVKVSDTTKKKFFWADFFWEWSKNMTKILRCRFKQCFGPFTMFTAHTCFDTRHFMYLSNPAFCSLSIQREITSEAQIFLQTFQDFIYLSEMQKTIGKIFCDLEISAFELVPLKSRFYWERILVIGIQYVNSLKIWDTTNKEFLELIFFQSDQKYFKKMLSCRFKWCFARFNMLTVHRCSDTGFFRHFLQSIISEWNQLWGLSFFSNYSKF